MNKLTFAVALTSLVVLMPALALGQASLSSPSAVDTPAVDALHALQLEALRVAGGVLLDASREEADRLNMATVLVRVGDRTALPLLTTSLLHDPFASVRRVVAEGLGRYQAPELIFSLREAALSGPIDSVRWAAAVSLVQTDASQGDVLKALLAERDTLAAAALSLQDDAALAALPEAFHSVIEAAFLAAFPQAAIYNNVERAAIAKSLATLGGKRAGDTLLAALTDRSDDAFVRGAAAFGLGLLGVEAAVPDLIAALDEESEPLKIGALAALGRLGDAQAVGPLVAFVTRETSAEVRAAGVAALGAFGNQVEDTLIGVLESDPHPAVRQAAVEALVGLGGQAATQALVAFATGPYLAACDPQACSTLALALMAGLARLDQGELALQLLQTAINSLVDALPFVFAFAEPLLISTAVEVGRAVPSLFEVLLANDNAFVQAIALGALPAVQGESARGVLLKFAAPEQNRLLRRMALEGLASLVTAADLNLFLGELQNRDRRTRAAAFAAIVRVGDVRAIQPLLDALASDSLAIRFQAVEAAIQFGNRWLN